MPVAACMPVPAKSQLQARQNISQLLPANKSQLQA